MPEFCRVQRDGRLTTVTITRPERLNAIHPPASLEMSEIFDDFASDPEQWVAIVTGEGRAFSAGNDLRYLADGGDLSHGPTGFAGLSHRFDMVKPIIASVNGVAMGGGFELALACDLIIASEEAVFALPESRVGVAAMGGGLCRLPRQIGAQQALGMILTGRNVSAAEGKQLGFVNEVVAADKLADVTREWADQIVACSPLSTRAAKDVVYRSLDCPSLEQSMRQQYDSLDTLYNSQDFIEGPRAFSEKRTPNWQGK